MYFLSSWICTKSSKNLFVKIVHPGGHVEIHDRPLEASELLIRNPKCCVAHPTVFHRPYAIVSPATTLALGQKYYVVPIATVRKLQLKYSASQSKRGDIQSNDGKQKTEKRDGDRNKMEKSSCWLMRNNKNGRKVKSGRKACLKESSNNKTVSETKSLSLASNFDHWQPGLESIIEE